MSGEVETSQAELDLTALEGVLGEPGLGTTRCAARPLQHLRGHRMVLVMATRTRGAKEYRLLKESGKMASFTSSRKRGVRGDRAKLQSRLHLDGWLLR
jgi:hypothetical protein